MENTDRGSAEWAKRNVFSAIASSKWANGHDRGSPLSDICVAGKMKVLVTYEVFFPNSFISSSTFSIFILSLSLQRSVAALDQL